MTKAQLISCFVVSPILLDGERKMDCLVQLTEQQLRGFKTLEPCPVRVVQAVEPVQVPDGEPEQVPDAEPVVDVVDATQVVEEPAPMEPVPEPEPEPEPDPKTEAPAQTQAKARAKKAQ